MEKHVVRMIRSVKENQFAMQATPSIDSDVDRSQVVATSSFHAYIHRGLETAKGSI